MSLTVSEVAVEEESLPVSTALGSKCQRGCILNKKIPPHGSHRGTRSRRDGDGKGRSPGPESHLPPDCTGSLAKQFSSLSTCEETVDAAWLTRAMVMVAVNGGEVSMRTGVLLLRKV